MRNFQGFPEILGKKHLPKKEFADWQTPPYEYQNRNSLDLTTHPRCKSPPGFLHFLYRGFPYTFICHTNGWNPKKTWFCRSKGVLLLQKKKHIFGVPASSCRGCNLRNQNYNLQRRNWDTRAETVRSKTCHEIPWGSEVVMFQSST